MSKQDIKLREAVALYKGQNWGKVSSYMGGTRSSNQCGQRWHTYLKLADFGLMKKGAWTNDEV